MRLSVAVAVSCLVLTGLSAADRADAAIKKQTNIASQSLGSALQALAKDRELQVLYRTEVVSDRHTSGAVGEFTFDEALTKLLHGSNLTFQYLDDKTVTILPLTEATTSQAGASSPGRLRIAQTDSPQATTSAEAGTSTDTSELKMLMLEEIIVTAQKRQERIQDVPVPVATLSGEALASSNQLRLQDYYNKIPGLSLALVGNGNEPVITIRGVTTGGVEPVNPTVGIVVDEVPYGASVAAPSVPDVDPSDLSRVEVLRGPQGTLYGATSIGGLLKFVTVDPSTDAVSGRIQAGFSSVADGELGHTLRGAANIPLGDTIAVRASGFTTRDPGYVDNVQTGEDDINRRESEGGRLSALWRPSDDFSLKLSALIQKSERLGAPDVDVSLGSALQQDLLRGTGEYGRDTQAYSAILTGRLGAVELTSVTGYNVDELSTDLDATDFFGFGSLADSFFGAAGCGIALQNDIEKFTQEVRASLPLGDKITWLVGAFYTDEDIQRANDAQAVDPATGAVAGLLLGSSLPITFEERAAFSNLTVEVTDRFDVQFGGRISENEQTFSTVRTGILADIFFGGDPFVVPDASAKDTAFTYLVTPRFRVSPDLMVYARLASGYRPGGPNVSCGIAGIPCEFEADTTQNFEVGFKGSILERSLSFDASLYYIDWKDIQMPLAAGAFFYTDNAARAESRGVELSVETRPLSGLTVSAWLVWNEAELSEDFPIASTIAGRSGDRLPYSSRFSGNLSMDREFPLWSTATGFVGGSVSYAGDRKGTFKATTVRETFPAYTQVDLRTGLRFDTWSLNVYVNNVTDKRGVLNGGLDAIVDPNLFAYIQPRTVGATLTKTF